MTGVIVFYSTGILLSPLSLSLSLSHSFTLSLSSLSLSLPEIARRLVDLCGSRLVAITDGSRGSVLATKDCVSTSLHYMQ